MTQHGDPDIARSIPFPTAFRITRVTQSPISLVQHIQGTPGARNNASTWGRTNTRAARAQEGQREGKKKAQEGPDADVTDEQQKRGGAEGRVRTDGEGVRQPWEISRGGTGRTGASPAREGQALLTAPASTPVSGVPAAKAGARETIVGILPFAWNVLPPLSSLKNGGAKTGPVEEDPECVRNKLATLPPAIRVLPKPDDLMCGQADALGGADAEGAGKGKENARRTWWQCRVCLSWRTKLRGEPGRNAADERKRSTRRVAQMPVLRPTD